MNTINWTTVKREDVKDFEALVNDLTLKLRGMISIMCENTYYVTITLPENSDGETWVIFLNYSKDHDRFYFSYVCDGEDCVSCGNYTEDQVLDALRNEIIELSSGKSFIDITF